jgi:hypothetical protein
MRDVEAREMAALTETREEVRGVWSGRHSTIATSSTTDGGSTEKWWSISMSQAAFARLFFAPLMVVGLIFYTTFLWHAALGVPAEYSTFYKHFYFCYCSPDLETDSEPYGIAIGE